MPKKILVVDDESNVLLAFKDRIQMAGYEVITATDGILALEKIKADPPDLIVLDIVMPKMDGIELCCILKADENYKHIPVILVTATVRGTLRKICDDVGADAYSQKTPDNMELIETIKRFI